MFNAIITSHWQTPILAKTQENSPFILWLSPYSTASHAKGRFFCTFLSKGKKNIIKSRHIRVNCVHFQSQHGLVFAQFFSFFPCFSAVIVVILSCGHKFEGTHLKEEKNRATHASFFLLLLRQKQCGSSALVPFGSLFLTFLTFLHYLSRLRSNILLLTPETTYKSTYLDISFKEGIKYRHTERVESQLQSSEKSNKI